MPEEARRPSQVFWNLMCELESQMPCRADRLPEGLKMPMRSSNTPTCLEGRQDFKGQTRRLRKDALGKGSVWNARLKVVGYGQSHENDTAPISEAAI
jgi:hypothetical protein